MMRARRLFIRDLSQGRLTLLIVSGILAVAIVTSIAVLTERIRGTLLDEAGALIAADMDVAGSGPVPETWREEASARGLQQADVVSFSSMLFGPSGNQLGSVRAVSDHYPLRGNLEVADRPFGTSRQIAGGPEPGEVWLASRLFPLLGVETGDRLDIGAGRFVVTRALVREPDRGAGAFDLEPRALIHRDDLAKTGVVQPGSRVRYRWLLAGPDDALSALRQALEGSADERYRWQTSDDADTSVRNALDRAEQFLLLSGALAVILAGVALAMAAQRYVSRQTDTVALLKTLGMTPAQIARHYGIGLLVLSLLAVSSGLLLGELLHRFLVWLLSDLLPDPLAGAGLRPYGLGVLTGAAVFLGFAWAPFLRLRRIPPIRVLRSEAGNTVRGIDWLWGSIAVVALVFLYSGNLVLTGVLLLGVLLVFSGAAVLALLLSVLLRRLTDRAGRTWRLGLANLLRHRRQNLFQIVVFAIAFMLLFTLVLARTTLLAEWQSQLPDKTPNHFVYNVFSEDLPQLNRWLEENAANASPAYPIVRGRLTRAGGESVERLTEDLPDQGNYTRELNLTWSETFGGDNEIVAGDDWEDYGTGPLRVSVEAGFAETLGLTPGDRVAFNLGGLTAEAEVASLRSLDWESFNPNFYMIFNQPVGSPDSAFYLVSFWLPPDRKENLSDLLREIPTLALIEVDQILAQIRTIIDQVTLAVEFVLSLVLLSGVLVLLASIQATLDSRFREGALLRTMGASGTLLRRMLWIEFGALGLLSGVLAVLGTEVVLYYLQTRVFDLPPVWHPLLWLCGPPLAAGTIGLIGTRATARIARVPPLAVLGEWQT